MAVFPNVTGQPIGPHLPTQPINIQAWTEQATESLNAISLSSPTGVRGTSVPLAIPLDEQAAAKRSTGAAEEQHAPDTTEAFRARREPFRRDSLKRREALLKGKEGSRRRQRWENAKKGADAKKHEAQKKHAQVAAGNTKVPRELREKLKKTKAAKGLLQDLEEQVRSFVKQWEDKNKKPAPAPKPELDSDDEEIVFIGRNGQMHDVPQSPHAARDDFDEDDIKRDKLVFDSLADDHGASFGRWLVHSIATYYDLHTWSVTVGHPARREAYVALKSGRPVSPTGTLPRPLWGMV
ncbi:MAG: hypothetical protein Q9218_002047 [Villophora microphyllina]